jgi:hypothetical protein
MSEFFRHPTSDILFLISLYNLTFTPIIKFLPAIGK